MSDKRTAEEQKPKEEGKKKEKSKLSTDQWLKLGGLILTLVGTIIAVLKFSPDSPKRLSEEQKEFYVETSDVIGKLISSDSIINQVTASEFYSLYNGRMILVEDSIVSRAMRRFKFELDDKRNGVENALNPNKFQKTGIELIETFKNALDEE